MFPSIFLFISIDMDQQQPFPNGTQIAPDGQQYQQQQQQQQPQWQPQQHTMPMQQAQPQPQPQYAQLSTENPTMQMPMQNASTPQLNAMYSQGGLQQYEQPVQQENLGYAQQGFIQQPQEFTQQPQAFQDNNSANVEQMQQAPQNFAQQVPAQEYHQPAQFDPSMNPGNQQGQFQQGQQPFLQQQAAPQAGYQFVQEGGQPAWPGQQPVNTGNAGPHADAAAWEQAHVTEVNDNAGFNQQLFAGGPPPPTSQQQHQNQAIREAELHNARQRIEALEAEREQQEVAQALAASARDAPDLADIEEQLQQQIHQAQLLSLDAWEQEVRRKLQQQQGGNNQAGGMYDGGIGGGSWQQQPLTPPSHLGSNFSDPRGGAALNGPVPSMQQGQMPPPPIPSARSSVSNLGFRSPTPRSQTPTRGVPLSDAARNAAAEDAQRWEAYQRGQNAHGGASVSAGSEYTVIPEDSEASTARGGSKGKGRMS
jgi:hypothetical protein